MQEHDNEVENKDDVREYEKTDGKPNIQFDKVFFSIDIYIYIYIFVLILTGRCISCAECIGEL